MEKIVTAPKRKKKEKFMYTMCPLREGTSVVLDVSTKRCCRAVTGGALASLPTWAILVVFRFPWKELGPQKQI